VQRRRRAESTNASSPGMASLSSSRLKVSNQSVLKTLSGCYTGGGEYKHDIIASADIDHILCVCASLPEMAAFKTSFLSTFDGTDESKGNDYLGCEIVRD
jgi:hypothetical protein